MKAVVGEEALSADDLLYLEFLNKFAHDNDRSNFWALLKEIRPTSFLVFLSTEQIERFYLKVIADPDRERQK